MKKRPCLIPLLILFLNTPVIAQVETSDTLYSVYDTLSNNVRLFDSEKVLNIRLCFDLTYYKKKKPYEEYIDGLLEYCPEGKDTIRKNIRLRTRGGFRRMFCDFPPIRLNFKKTVSPHEEFTQIDKIKMVTHCKTGFGENVLREYLIYKLFNVLTENSYKVRLLRISYINTNPKKRNPKPTIEYAFVIEPDEYLAKRINFVEVEATTLTQKNIDQESIDRLAIFNYMIGNTDWAVPGLHNVTVLSENTFSSGGIKVIVVPYDFDYCGLVNAPYAIPYEKLPIANIRERYYTGICRKKEVLKNTLNEFADKKDEFYRIIGDFQYLGEKSKKDMITYLDSFFSLFDKNDTIVNKIIADCKDF